MRPQRDLSSIDAEFRAAGLEPLDAFTSAGDERRCRCTRCGTTRLVRLSNLRQGGVACRWCHGWERGIGWSESARTRAVRTKLLGTPADVLERLRLEHLSALTPMGDLYQPVGVVCLTCGERSSVCPCESMPKDRDGTRASGALRTASARHVWMRRPSSMRTGLSYWAHAVASTRRNALAARRAESSGSSHITDCRQARPRSAGRALTVSGPTNHTGSTSSTSPRSMS